MADDDVSSTTDTVGSGGRRDANRWKRELSLASKREKDWRDYADKIVRRYRGEEKKKNRWNVLWSNTATLRPFIYNSRANPDVRRRFRDADPLGKAVSVVLERGLTYVVDDYSTDCSIKNDILDALLPGRGVSRVRYIPSIREVDAPEKSEAGDAPPNGPAASATGQSAANAGPSPSTQDAATSNDGVAEEELEYERVTVDHVSWKDFRHGYGRVWEEVPWVAYRHKLTEDEATEKFGKDAIANIKFAVPTTDDPKKPGDETSETQKVAEFWEFWDKGDSRVFFTNDVCHALLFPIDNPKGEPPLDLPGFFPNPQPLYMVEDTDSLLPIPLFQLYEQQADELDKLSRRIDRVVDSMKLRGIYDAKLTEMNDVMSLDDNELTPVQNAQAWRDGGLDKAISWLPIDQCAAVLQGLYLARSQTKTIIDELMGIADIMRGATDPQETATAQGLKQTNGNTRLQWMRGEVQRYIRDLLRLCAAVIATKFSQQTLASMTELQFPTKEQKAALMQQAQAAQAAAMQPPMPGQPPAAPPPPPELLQVPSWDEILEVLHNNALRYFKVDVETDSTVAGTLQDDMVQLTGVIDTVVKTLTELGPLVSLKALPYEAAKELVLAIVRRAKLGMAVEDAFEKLQPPPPPPPNAQGKPDPTHAAQIKADADVQVAQVKADADNKQAVMQATLDAKIEQMREDRIKDREQQAEQNKAMRDHWNAQLDAAVRVITTTISANKMVDAGALAVAEPVFARDLTGSFADAVQQTMQPAGIGHPPVPTALVNAQPPPQPPQIGMPPQ